MAAPRYRIGNDLTVFWAIHNRDGSPFDFNGKEIRLYVTNERGRQEVKASLSKLEDGTENNVIRWDFDGRDQKVLGLHSLSVEIQDKGDTREITKDYSEAFIFVSRSEMEDEEGDANISIRGDLILSSKLDVYRFEAVSVDVSDLKSSIVFIESELSKTNKSVAEQTIKVSNLSAEINTKASVESVSKIGDEIVLIEEAAAQQTIRVDGLEASIENKVSKEVFDVKTGEIDNAYTTLKQTTEGIEATVKANSGEITSIKQNINGLSVSIGKVEEDFKSLQNKVDGVTESYFLPYEPTLENEPAVSWIRDGEEEAHIGDTFTNTALEGESAGKSWRWLQTDGVWGWTPIADTDAQKALALAAKAQAAADGKVTIFYEQPKDYKVGDIWFVHNNNYAPYGQGEILSSTADSSIFDLSHWEDKTRYTNAINDLDETMNTTFKDGVLDEAERKVIKDSLNALDKEKEAVDADYNIVIINANFADAELKAEYKASKDKYDDEYETLRAKVVEISETKQEGDELKALFAEYESESKEYSKAYGDYTTCKARVTEALQGRMNPANIYIENIASDGYLTPIEKEQLFEIYRGLAKEYDTARGNAYNYKVWKYAEDGETEISGVNGTNGRFEIYQTYKQAFLPILDIFTSNTFGFDKMSYTTALPDGYSVSYIKSCFDTYYEAIGALSEVFSAITAAIEDAQKAGENTLRELTDVLAPEEMQTLVGKGVVLSTIIATKDKNGNITAGMNASDEFKDETHGRIVFVGGVNETKDWLESNFIVFEDGHIILRSGEIKDNVKVGSALLNSVVDGEINLLSYTRKVNGDVVSTPLFLVETDDKGSVVGISTPYNFYSNGELASGAGGGNAPIGITGIIVNGTTYRDNNGDGIVDLGIISGGEVDVDLSDYYTKQEIESKGYATHGYVDTQIKNIDLSAYATEQWVKNQNYATTNTVNAVSDRVLTLESYFSSSEDADSKINKWNEIVAFLNATEGTTLAGILEAYTLKSVYNAFVTSTETALANRYTKTEVNNAISSVDNKYASTKAWADTLASLIVNDGGKVRIKASLIVEGDSASGGAGGGSASVGITGILVNGKTYTDDNGDGVIDLGTITSGLTSVSWTDVIGRPTKLSQFTNDLGLGSLAYVNSLSKSDVGLGNVENKSSATIRGEITSANITTALGYTPYNSANFTKANIKSTLGISDWALASSKPTYTASDVGALSVNGGTIDGVSTTATPLKLNTDLSAITLHLRVKSTNKAEVGWDSSTGVYIYNYASAKYIGIKDNGTPHYSGNTLYHTGNFNPANYLPLSGGTISVISDEGISINRTNGTRAVLSFKVDGGYKGGLGIDTDGVPFYRTYVGGIHTLYHAGNFNPANYLPLSGGTIENVTGTYTPLFVKTTDPESWIGFTDNVGTYYIGTYRGVPSVYKSGVGTHTLIHSGNIGEQRAQRAKYLDTLNVTGANWYDNQYVVYGQWGRDDVLDWKVDNYEVRVDRAKKLQTARTIWGQSFDGTGNVSGNLSLGNGGILGGASSVNMLYYDTSNTLYLGYGMSGVGGSVICGNGIAMRYGSSRNMGFLLNSSGNVTIGSSDLAGTSAKLYVDGRTYSKTGFLFEENYGIWKGGQWTGSLATTDILYNATKHIFNNGNVLIGTTTDNGSKLQVKGSAKFYSGSSDLELYSRILASGIQVGRTTLKYTGGYNGGLQVGEDGTNVGYIAGVYDDKDSSTRKFFYGGTAHVSASIVINGLGGNVFIGKNTDDNSGAKLQVKGWANMRYVEFTNAANNGMAGYIGRGSSNDTIYLNTYSASDIVFRTNDKEAARINASGNVLIGTTTDAGYKLYVNGTARIADAVKFAHTLSVEGAVTMSSTLSVAGATTINGALTAGATTINGNLVVTGDVASA